MTVFKKPKPTIYQLLTTNYSLPTNAGFSLVETLVSISIFSVIMLIMGGIFVSSLDLQRKGLNIQVAEENAGFVLESMSKEVRASQITSSDSNCPAVPAATLSVNHPVNGAVTYSLSGGAVHRLVAGMDTVMSSNTVQFTRLQFCVFGAMVGDHYQPRVTIIGSVKSVKTKQPAAIDFQTTITPRFLSD